MPIPYQKSHGGTNIVTTTQVSSSSFNAKGYEDISTNANAISTNANAIAANTVAITTNGTAISTNANAIAANTVAITTNGTAISTNATDITNLQNRTIPYSTLTGLPTIPTNNNQLTNGQGFITSNSLNNLTFNGYSTSIQSGNHYGSLSFFNNGTIDGVVEFRNHAFFTGTSGINHGNATSTSVSAFFRHSIAYGSAWGHSDDRLKYNEVDISNGLDIIRQLKPKVYNKSADMYDSMNLENYKEIGLIAQDLLAINDISFTVMGGDYTDSSGVFTESPHYVKYDDIFTYNIAATKDLDIEVEKIKEENKILKSTLNSLLIDLGREPIVP